METDEVLLAGLGEPLPQPAPVGIRGDELASAGDGFVLLFSVEAAVVRAEVEVNLDAFCLLLQGDAAADEQHVGGGGGRQVQHVDDGGLLDEVDDDVDADEDLFCTG